MTISARNKKRTSVNDRVVLRFPDVIMSVYDIVVHIFTKFKFRLIDNFTKLDQFIYKTYNDTWHRLQPWLNQPTYRSCVFPLLPFILNISTINHSYVCSDFWLYIILFKLGTPVIQNPFDFSINLKLDKDLGNRKALVMIS